MILRSSGDPCYDQNQGFVTNLVLVVSLIKDSIVMNVVVQKAIGKIGRRWRGDCPRRFEGKCGKYL